MNPPPKLIHKKSNSLAKPVSNQNIKNLVFRSNKYFRETTTFMAKIKENTNKLKMSFENEGNESNINSTNNNILNRNSDGIKLNTTDNNFESISDHHYIKTSRASKFPSVIPSSFILPPPPPPPSASSSVPLSFLFPSSSSSLKLRNFNKIISLNSKGLQNFTLTHHLETQSVLILELKNNRLKLFPPDILKLKQLQTLKLDGNFLKELPDELFKGLEHLEILSVSDNMLLKMPKNLSYCKKLKVLNLSENHLDMIGEEIGQLINLKSLMIQMNHFHLIPGNLGSLKGLKEFGLDWFKYLEKGLESVQMMQDGGEMSVLRRFLELVGRVGKESSHLTFPEFLEGMDERRREENGEGREEGGRGREEGKGKRKMKEGGGWDRNKTNAETNERKKKEEGNGRKEGGVKRKGEVNENGESSRRYKGEGVKRIYEKGRTMLHKASIENDIGVIRAILNKEYAMIDLLDSSQQTALFLAIRHENYLSAKVLLHSGSNPMASSHFLGSCLNLAIVKGQYYLVADLIKFGDDPCRTDSDGNTPLHVLMCVFDSDPDVNTQIGTLLLQSNCSPNKLNIHFLSPFHLAVRRCQIHALKWISQQKVFDPNQLGGESSQTPLMMACEQGFVSGVQILLGMSGLEIWEGGGAKRKGKNEREGWKYGEGRERKEEEGRRKEEGEERKKKEGEEEMKEEGRGRKSEKEREGVGKEEEEAKEINGTRRALSYSMRHYKIMKLIYCREKFELWNSILKGLPRRRVEEGEEREGKDDRGEEEVESEEENTTFRKILDLNQITMEKRLALFKSESRTKSLGYFKIESKDLDRSMSDIEENKSDKENNSKVMRNFIGSPNNIRKLDFLQRLNSLLDGKERGEELRKEVGRGWKEVEGIKERGRKEEGRIKDGEGFFEERRNEVREKGGVGRRDDKEKLGKEEGGKNERGRKREGSRREEGVAKSLGGKLSLKSLSMENLQETIGKLNGLVEKLKNIPKYMKETLTDNSQPISVKAAEINNLFYFQCELNYLVKKYKEEKENIEHAQTILKENINTISIDLDKSMNDFLNSKTERHFFNMHNDDLALRQLFYIFLLLTSNITGGSFLKSQIIKIFEFFSFKNLLTIMKDKKYYHNNDSFIIYESFQSVLMNDSLFFKKNSLKSILANNNLDNNQLNNFRNSGLVSWSKNIDNSNELKPINFFDDKIKISQRDQRISINSKSSSNYILNPEDGRLITDNQDNNYKCDFGENFKKNQTLNINHQKLNTKATKPLEDFKNSHQLPNSHNNNPNSMQTKTKTNRIFSESTPRLQVSDFPLLEINNLNFKINENITNMKENSKVLEKDGKLNNDANGSKNHIFTNAYNDSLASKNNNIFNTSNCGNNSKNNNFLGIINYSLGLTEFTPEGTRNSALMEEDEDGFYRIERMKAKEKSEIED